MDFIQEKLKKQWFNYPKFITLKTVGENITEEVLNKKILRYEEAVKEAKERIEEYETFHFLYISIIKELELFDKDGNLKDKEEVNQNITAALDLLEEMGKNSVIQSVKKIRRNLPDMLNYFDIAKSVITKISKTIPIDQEIISCLFIAGRIQQLGEEIVNQKHHQNFHSPMPTLNEANY